MRLVEKYRPARLEDVIGQEKAIAQLRRILKRGIGGRALLFEGPPGVGKTTTALILARMLEIMGDNETLESLQKGSSMDLRFFEANKMDAGTVEKLADWFMYAPWRDEGYKMVIIDEAQTMTKGGANGLLSLMEALPSYCVVVLTTTAAALQEELFKQESAFGSRCLTVSFEVPDKDALGERLGDIARAEVGMENAVGYFGRFDEIARKAKGNVRAAVQLLDTILDEEAA